MTTRCRIVSPEILRDFHCAPPVAGASAKSSPTRRTASRALLAACLALGGAQALAVNLIFDSSPPPITTAQTADTSLWVGVNNPGVNLTIGAGGAVTVNAGGNSATVGLNASSDGNSLGVNGAGASLLVGETAYVGYAGANNVLTVGTGGGSVSALDVWIGGLAGSTGNSVTVTGPGTVGALNSVVLGYGDGGNVLMVQSGGQVDSFLVSTGFVAGAAANTATVTGSGSRWASTGHFFFGENSSGNQLTVSNQGKVAADFAGFDLLIGANPGANSNTVQVTGSGSVLSNLNGTLYVGRGGNSNLLQIQSGGSVTSKNVRIGGGTGASGTPTGNTVVVDGGSTWTVSGTLRVGAGVAGTNSGLDVTAGGIVTVAGNSFIGYDATSDNNHALVSGTGSQWNAQALTIGNAPGSTNNVLTLAYGGVLSATAIAIGDSSGLMIGSGAAAGSIASPVTITGLGTGAYVKFNHADANYTFASSLTGTVGVSQDGSGTTTLTGSNTYTGPTAVTAGLLNINSINGTSGITVGAGTTLGVLAGSTGTTTGNYTQDAAGVFRTYISDNTTFGKLVVNGTVSMSGNNYIDVQVANCGIITSGTVFPGVISSASTIAATSFTVTDNCLGLLFTARRNASTLAIDLIATAPPLIPTLSAPGMIALAAFLALAAIGALRRRA